MVAAQNPTLRSRVIRRFKRIGQIIGQYRRLRSKHRVIEVRRPTTARGFHIVSKLPITVPADAFRVNWRAAVQIQFCELAVFVKIINRQKTGLRVVIAEQNFCSAAVRAGRKRLEAKAFRHGHLRRFRRRGRFKEICPCAALDGSRRTGIIAGSERTKGFRFQELYRLAIFRCAQRGNGCRFKSISVRLLCFRLRKFKNAQFCFLRSIRFRYGFRNGGKLFLRAGDGYVRCFLPLCRRAACKGQCEQQHKKDCFLVVSHVFSPTESCVNFITVLQNNQSKANSRLHSNSYMPLS